MNVHTSSPPLTASQRRRADLDFWLWAEPDREDRLYAEFEVECAARSARGLREREVGEFLRERYRHDERERIRRWRQDMFLDVELPAIRRGATWCPSRTLGRVARRPRERHSARAAASSRAGPNQEEGPEPPRTRAWEGERGPAGAGGAL